MSTFPEDQPFYRRFEWKAPTGECYVAERGITKRLRRLERSMHVIKGSDAPSDKGTTFTGDVTLTRLLGADAGNISVSSVHFEDGARTNWHDHPGEQVLYVLEGEARAGTADEELRAGPGDIIYMPAGERHWHGAVEGQSMTHLSITTVGSPTWYESPED